MEQGSHLYYMGITPLSGQQAASAHLQLFIGLDEKTRQICVKLIAVNTFLVDSELKEVSHVMDTTVLRLSMTFDSRRCMCSGLQPKLHRLSNVHSMHKWKRRE